MNFFFLFASLSLFPSLLNDPLPSSSVLTVFQYFFPQMKYANGDIFVGEWSNDLPNGSGELTLSNGLFYTGDFKDGQFEGRGVLYSPSGKCYQGTWVSGKRHGKDNIY